jgi:NAD(P)H-hydrate epimerase
VKSGGRLFPRIDAQAVPWVSVEQMREVDRIMVEELGISLVRMMENAGRSLAQLARDLLDGDTRARSILVLAGPGGNGGGGLVAARHLASAGARVAVALSARPPGASPRCRPSNWQSPGGSRSRSTRGSSRSTSRTS